MWPSLLFDRARSESSRRQCWDPSCPTCCCSSDAVSWPTASIESSSRSTRQPPRPCRPPGGCNLVAADSCCVPRHHARSEQLRCGFGAVAGHFVCFAGHLPVVFAVPAQDSFPVLRGVSRQRRRQREPPRSGSGALGGHSHAVCGHSGRCVLYRVSG